MTGKRKIVVVDDEDGVREAIRLVLEDAGFEVSDTRSWQEARPLAADADLVILDMIMPGASGLEAIDELRSQRGATKIIGISGAADTLEAACHFGADKILSKPFSGPALLSTVEALLWS